MALFPAVPPWPHPLPADVRSRSGRASRLQQRSSPHPPPALLFSIATDDAATGGACVSQPELAAALASALGCGRLPFAPSFAASLPAAAAAASAAFAAAGVATRGACSPVDEHSSFALSPGLPPAPLEPLLARASAAARRALTAWSEAGGAGEAGITHLVVACNTSPRGAPGLDVSLARRLGLSSAVQRVPVHHAGTAAGLAALGLAASLARGGAAGTPAAPGAGAAPLARVLVVAVDAFSAFSASLPGALSSRDVSGLATFSDGAAAAVVGCRPRGRARSGGAQSSGGLCETRESAAVATILHHSQLLGPEEEEIDGAASGEGEGSSDGPAFAGGVLAGSFSRASRGLAVTCHHPIATSIAPLLPEFVASLIGASQRGSDDERDESDESDAQPLHLHTSAIDATPPPFVVLPPVDAATLSAWSHSLRLTDDELGPTRGVLASRGCAGGASPLMALAAAVEKMKGAEARTVPSSHDGEGLHARHEGNTTGRLVCVVAVGPGPTLEGVVLEMGEE